MQEQVDIEQVISNRKYSWYDKIRTGDWWNRIRVVKPGVSKYSIIIIKPEIRSKTRYNQSWQSIPQVHSWHLLLLLLLVLPWCLDMWTSVPAHIYPHLSKARLLLETNGGINEQCLQWVPYIPGTTTQDCSVAWWTEPAARRSGGSYRMPLSRWYQEGGSQHSPRSPGGPQVRPEVLVAQHA